MSEVPNIPAFPSESVRPASPARTTGSGETSSSGSPAFEVLLERLTTRAAELEERSRSLATPEELSGAMDAARASFEDALTLGEELLEAFRARQHAPEKRP